MHNFTVSFVFFGAYFIDDGRDFCFELDFMIISWSINWSVKMP